MEANTKQSRAAWHCAWMPRREWTGYGFVPPKDWPPRLDKDEDETVTAWYQRCRELACPGYSVQLPEVIEAARLYRWFDKGSLRDALGDTPVTPKLRDSLDIFASAISEVEMAQIGGVSDGH